AITYSKGASALTQLVHYVGLEAFFAGCRLYFERHAFGNATLTDFLAALTETSGRDLQTWADAWLQTRGHDELTAEVTESDGVIESLVIRRGPGPMADGTRPHATTLGLYDLVDGRLTLRQRHDVLIEADATELPRVAGQQVPAVILPNDTDQTFVRVRLDGRTRAALLTNIGDLEPLVRATSWAALFADVRDTTLPVRDYVAAVITHGPHEDRTGTLTALIGHVEDALERFAPDDVELGERWRHTCRVVAEDSEPGSMRQLQWLKAHVRAAALAPSDLRWILDGELPGLELSDDLRWLVWQSLAAQGAASSEELDRVLSKDDTASGVLAHLRAWYARPDGALKQEAWRRAHTVDGETNAHVDALLQGIFAPGQQVDDFVEPYFASLRDVWRDHPIEIARRLVVGGFPRDVAHLDDAAAWLAAEEDAPAALRRLVVEQHFELAVAARVQGAQLQR
ncbi:MAG: ERAP1-like C-terminal domain-containing protein, partial [Propionibacteriaceae bacterium]|nr:ERAP1-like C-terminal domain-containing protein [Propionibacteriaceae bacterium]